MQTFTGADPEQLDALAGRFSSAADELEKIRSTVGGTLGRTPWDGRDADQFRDTWRSRHSATVSTACQVLRDAAKALRTNASDQRGASASSGGATSGSAAPTGPTTTPHTAPAPTPAPQNWPVHREIPDVKAAYDSWAAGTRYADANLRYQCTSWANFRWHELGYDGPPIGGNGYEMADRAGHVSDQPSLYAMASYGDGKDTNHVMIVEEVRPDGTIRLSEMNAGDNVWNNATADEYRDKRTISPVGGKYYAQGQEIKFAAFPG